MGSHMSVNDGTISSHSTDSQQNQYRKLAQDRDIKAMAEQQKKKMRNDSEDDRFL